MTRADPLAVVPGAVNVEALRLAVGYGDPIEVFGRVYVPADSPAPLRRDRIELDEDTAALVEALLSLEQLPAGRGQAALETVVTQRVMAHLRANAVCTIPEMNSCAGCYAKPGQEHSNTCPVYAAQDKGTL